MKFLIPAKCSSSRMPDKNWREFHEGESLVEIKIKQLLKATTADNIFVSCDNEEKRPLVESLGAQFLMRDEAYSKDDMHWCDVVTELVESVPCERDEDVGWVFATTPLFDDYAGIVSKWHEVKDEHDCILAVKPMQHYMVDEKGRPVNFSFGRWHGWSQHLPKWYILAHPVHIMKKRTFLDLEYYIGTKPYLYEVEGPAIDIDHPHEFEVAQELFKRRVKEQNELA